MYIRASVDAPCRDGADEISRDPCRKQLKPRGKSLAKPLKLPSNCCTSYTSTQQVHMYCQFSTRENGQMQFREFHVIIIIIIFFFFFFLFKPAISLLGPIEALIFPLNVSTEDGGVHGYPAFVFYMLYVTTAFRHALRGETVNDAIFLDSSMHSARERSGLF